MNIIIAEDDKFYARYLEYTVKLCGDHSVEKCDNSKELKKIINSNTDVLLLDFKLDNESGLGLFNELKKKYPNTEIIIISGQKDIEVALELISNGAFEYLVKNDETKNRLIHAINKLSKQVKLNNQLRNLQLEVEQKYDSRKLIISKDGAFDKIYGFINKASKSSINVSIFGATGTGKELVAKCIHFNSDRSKESFVAVNLSSFSESLIESELFGYEKGAFTGANERRIGYIEKANGGTLFLDEISEVPLSIQVKLLRVLQEREIMRIGSSKPIPLNCRIICASNKLLTEEVSKGNFRQDLFYRVIGLPIELPLLKDRGNDMIHLAKHFALEYAVMNNTYSFEFTEGALKKIKGYHYPGNVRELKSIIDLACVLSEDQIIHSSNIVFNEDSIDNHLNSEDYTLKEINEKIIRSMLMKYDNNVRLVARKLQIGKSTIYRLLQND